MFRDNPSDSTSRRFPVSADAVLVVTTPWNETERALAEAQRLAAWFDGRTTARRDRSIRDVLSEEGADVVVVADRQPVLYTRDSEDDGLYFHPSFAWQRIAQWRKGELERLLLATNIHLGDTIVDTTLGRGTDTLVFAAAAGADGHVIGIDGSWPLLRLFEDALVNGSPWYSDTLERLREGAAPITLCYLDHAEWLSEQPDDSVDVVYFDPMFRHATKRRSEVETVRSFANSSPIGDVAWREAQRIARRAVVLKERPGFGQFERFRLQPDRPHGRTAFGVWKKPRGGRS